MKRESLAKRLGQHLHSDPVQLPVVHEHFAPHERANLHLALEELLHGHDELELVGVIDYDYELSLGRLASKGSRRRFEVGPVEYIDAPLANGGRLACVKQALYLFQLERCPLAMLLADDKRHFQPRIQVEVTGANRAVAEAFLRRLVELTRGGKAFRGQVLSIAQDCYRQLTVNFHTLPYVRREDIILPDDVLRRIEQHTIEFSRHTTRLAQSGRHLKRGILLHGMPGTGKTFAAMYLASQMRDRTVLLTTGAGIGSIETVCNLARMLQPATVVLEDVDLIGTQREHQMVDANALLFELLNQMDGLAADADILFILTTNRPDILEPALASRPGRIDQAIEIPLPNLECRQRLLDLYAVGLHIERVDWARWAERTAGASAAFIKEFVRKAAVISAIEMDGDDIVVHDRHLDQAAASLLVAGGDLTRSLLGAARGTDEVN